MTHARINHFFELSQTILTQQQASSKKHHQTFSEAKKQIDLTELGNVIAERNFLVLSVYNGTKISPSLENIEKAINALQPLTLEQFDYSPRKALLPGRIYVAKRKNGTIFYSKSPKFKKFIKKGAPIVLPIPDAEKDRIQFLWDQELWDAEKKRQAFLVFLLREKLIQVYAKAFQQTSAKQVDCRQYQTCQSHDACQNKTYTEGVHQLLMQLNEDYPPSYQGKSSRWRGDTLMVSGYRVNAFLYQAYYKKHDTDPFTGKPVSQYDQEHIASVISFYAVNKAAKASVLAVGVYYAGTVGVMVCFGGDAAANAALLAHLAPFGMHGLLTLNVFLIQPLIIAIAVGLLVWACYEVYKSYQIKNAKETISQEPEEQKEEIQPDQNEDKSIMKLLYDPRIFGPVSVPAENALTVNVDAAATPSVDELDRMARPERFELPTP